MQEYKVITNCDSAKKFSILQFPQDQGFDKNSHVTLSRENNLKEYKSVYNIDAMPTTGAGSEFGREAKEEARRKKFGYIRKKYQPDAQPWLMQIGAEKSSKKFKGTRTGGISENASYFIFTKRGDVFEATPVEEWYNFRPTVSYNNLNAEEAEEEFARRDKNLNMFNIMIRKRIKKEDDEDEDSKEKVQKEIKSKSLMLTEIEDWADMSDEEGAAAGADSDDSTTGKKPGKGKGKAKRKGGVGKKKKKEQDTDDEAVEDSDDGDMEAKQVDYMSDTSESDSDMELRADKSKYEEKGVEDEDGLREIAAESDNETKKEETKKTKEEESERSSSSSESDSDDPDRKDDEFTKAFLMTGSKKDRGKSPVPRSTTPTDDRKRKLQASPRSSSPALKRVKPEPSDAKPSTSTSATAASNDGRPHTPVTSSSRDGLTEESVKRYLLRKPMSSKDLFKLFKSKKLGMKNDEIVTGITNIMKRLNASQQKINGVIHFYINE